MKRPVFEVLRRGFDNTVANWQLIVIRLIEIVVTVLISIGAVLAVVVPILVSIGINVRNIFTSPDEVESAVELLSGKWMLIVWIAVVITAVLTIATAIHSFVVAGSARIYADADRLAGPSAFGPRTRYRQFSMDKWMTEGKAGWWPVFWIYNLPWLLACAILLVPLVPTAAFIFLSQESAPQAALGIGCLGMLLTLGLAFLVGVIAVIWSNRAIASWSVRGGGARPSLAAAWSELKADFGRVILIAIAVFVVAMAGSSFFGGFSFIASFAEAFGKDSMAFFTLPMRIVASILSSAFSAAVSAWFLSAYCTLATERG